MAQISMTNESFKKGPSGYECPDPKCDRKDFDSPQAARMHFQRIHSKQILTPTKQDEILKARHQGDLTIRTHQNNNRIEKIVKRRSPEEIKSIIQTIENLNEQGKTIKEAAKIVGTGADQFYKWRRNHVENTSASIPVEASIQNRKTIRNPEEIKSIIKQIDDLRATGVQGYEACKKLGVNSSQYYSWKKLIRESANGVPEVQVRRQYVKRGANQHNIGQGQEVNFCPKCGTAILPIKVAMESFQ